MGLPIRCVGPGHMTYIAADYFEYSKNKYKPKKQDKAQYDMF